MTLLPATLTLSDLADAETLCRRVLDRELRSWTATLQPSDKDEALAHLITECWLLHESFDPARNDSFEGYAKKYLPLRVVDYFRDRFGRNGHHHPGLGAQSIDELASEPVAPETQRFPRDQFDKLGMRHKRIVLYLMAGWSQIDIARRTRSSSKEIASAVRWLRAEFDPEFVPQGFAEEVSRERAAA